MISLSFHGKLYYSTQNFEYERGQWLLSGIKQLYDSEKGYLTFGELKADYASQFDDFDLFWHSKQMDELREMGLIVV